MLKLWKNITGHSPTERSRFYTMKDELVDFTDRAAGANQLADNETLEKLQNYCVALDDTIETGKRLIEVKKELTTLTEIRHQFLNMEAMQVMPVVSEDNVPEELKCPVCFEIFGEGVIQCVNGHSTCIKCSEALRDCPECRVSYKDGKIRNRTVESLMVNLKICCIYSIAGCEKQLTCAEMQIHVETCEFMSKPVRSSEYKEIRKLARVKNGELKRLEKRLQECNSRLVESKAVWRNSQKELYSSDADSRQVKAIEGVVKDFKLDTMEVEMGNLYVELNTLISC